MKQPEKKENNAQKNGCPYNEQPIIIFTPFLRGFVPVIVFIAGYEVQNPCLVTCLLFGTEIQIIKQVPFAILIGRMEFQFIFTT